MSAAIGVDTGLVYEISFTPEIETKCVVDLEYLDIAEGVICGDSVIINVKAKDFRITPFPLQPFAINSKSTFNVEILMSDADGGVVDLSRLKFKIKPTSKESSDVVSQNSNCSNVINNSTVEDFEVVTLSPCEYQIIFTPKLIERHFFEIFLDNTLVNQGEWLVRFF